MKQSPVRTEQQRGSGRPFTKGDPRINRAGVPSEVRAFHSWMRQTFARSLQEEAEDSLTNGERIIRTLIQKAKEAAERAASERLSQKIRLQLEPNLDLESDSSSKSA